MCTGILGELDIFPRASEPRDVPSAGINRDIIVCGAVKEAKGPLAYFLVFEEYRVACRIKSDVGSELRPGGSVHALEALEAGIESHKAAFGEAHHRNPRAVDLRMLGKQMKGSIGVQDHAQVPKPRLVRDCLGDAPTRKAVKQESRCTYPVYFMGPLIYISPNTCRAVHQKDCRNFSCRHWEPQLSGNTDLRPFLRSGQKLFVRECDTFERMNFNS